VLLYAQSHALHWTQEYDLEEGLYTKIISCVQCWTLQNNRNSDEFKYIYRVWHEKV